MLKVNILHTVVPEQVGLFAYILLSLCNHSFRLQHLIRFQLDPTRPNLVMRIADGFWFTETVPSMDESSTPRTRVWLSANIMASRLVPSLVVDYAAYKALPRATTWLQPYFSGTPLKETFEIC